MSKTLLRFLALALLALSVPVQGMASVVAGQCMTFGHHPQPVDGDAHAHAHDADGDHAEHSQHADDAPNASHCGPCTACCASASIAGGNPLAVIAVPSSAQYVFSQSPPPAVQPDGLDRPPLPL